MSQYDGQTPQEEAADWANWLDRFEQYVWPVFERRGYDKDIAMATYFRIFPHMPVKSDDDDEEQEYD